MRRAFARRIRVARDVMFCESRLDKDMLSSSHINRSRIPELPVRAKQRVGKLGAVFFGKRDEQTQRYTKSSNIHAHTRAHKRVQK
jgi:hypothetical protein